MTQDNQGTDNNVGAMMFVTKTSCNMFSQDDINITKLLLIKKINEIISIRRLNQKEAAKCLDIDQPKISQMKNNKIAGFSLERLFKFLIKLGLQVSITLDRQ